MKKKTNYLDKIPACSSEISHISNDDGTITLLIENKGIANKIAQILLKKPRISHIHLDEIGSFVWLMIDGKKSIYDIAVSVDTYFGEKAQPLYERLIEFFNILKNNSLIIWIK